MSERSFISFKIKYIKFFSQKKFAVKVIGNKKSDVKIKFKMTKSICWMLKLRNSDFCKNLCIRIFQIIKYKSNVIKLINII